MDKSQLTADLKSLAAELGFRLFGVSPAVSIDGALPRFDAWLEAGYVGEMHYLSERREAYDHPRHVLEGVRSVLMLAMPYSAEPHGQLKPGQGRVSRYAWGTTDYHHLIRDRLHTLADHLRDWVPEAITRGVVDTAPLLEREFAQLAGLGWIGKNTLLLNKEIGSYFFLAALLTDLELQYDPPHQTDHCGTCTACLDACPTEAFVKPYVLDARRCISYLTIELQDHIPHELRAGMGEWVFGCDVCQDVCPWNREAPSTRERDFLPTKELKPLDLAALFDLDEAGFRQLFRQTPLWRSHRRGLLRNTAIVLGNQGEESAIPILCRGLQDVEPLVRAACAWALGQIGGENAQAQLASLGRQESDSHVRREIEAALQLLL